MDNGFLLMGGSAAVVALFFLAWAKYEDKKFGSIGSSGLAAA